MVIFAFPSSDDDDVVNVEGGVADGSGNDGEPDWNFSERSAPSSTLETKTDLLASVPRRNVDEDDGDIVATAKTIPSMSTTSTFAGADTHAEHDPTHGTKIHRLSPTHLLLTSGLAGDSRVLASAFRKLISRWTHVDHGEVASAREVAREVGKVRHGIGLRPGARVLGVVGMVIGLEDVEDDCGGKQPWWDRGNLGVEVRMYRSLPGGIMDRCNVCCTGGGADVAGNSARKDALEALSRVVSPNMEDCTSLVEQIGQTIEDERNTFSQKEKDFEKVIEEVGRVALKYHPDVRSKEEDLSDQDANRDKSQKRVAVDIWVVQAVPMTSSHQPSASLNALPDCSKSDYEGKGKDNADSYGNALDAIPKHDKYDNSAFISPHRYFGKASMEIRYARRVAVDHLTIAAQCLTRKNVNA